MMKLCLFLFVLQVCKLIVSAGKTNSTNDDLYSKFKQNDYNLTFEWAEVNRVNKHEVSVLNVRVFKYNRTSPALNVTVAFTFDIGYELELVIQTYKFLSNEYRYFPLRFQANFCKSLAANLFGSGRALNCGNFTGCPLHKNRIYHGCNWIPDQSQFPPLIPTGRYMLEFQGLYREKELWVIRAYGAISRTTIKN